MSTLYTQDIDQLFSEIEAGHFLPKDLPALPPMPEDADATALHINELYQKQIEELQARLASNAAQIDTLKAQIVANGKLQDENKALSDENDLLNKDLKDQQAQILVYLEQIKNLEKNVNRLEKELLKAKEAADEQVAGGFAIERQHLLDTITEMTIELGDKENTELQIWNTFFDTAIDENPENINVISMYLTRVITAAGLSGDIANKLYGRTSNLQQEQKKVLNEKEKEKEKSERLAPSITNNFYGGFQNNAGATLTGDTQINTTNK